MLKKTKAVKNVNALKFTGWKNTQSEIVRQVEFNTFCFCSRRLFYE